MVKLGSFHYNKLYGLILILSIVSTNNQPILLKIK